MGNIIGNLLGKKKPEKPSPQEVIARIRLAKSKLEGKKKELDREENRARNEAKRALQTGNEAEFRVASKKYSMIQGQLKAISGFIELAANSLNVLDLQQNFKEVVGIGELLKSVQSEMGLNTGQLEKAIGDIQATYEEVNGAAEMINNAVGAMINTGELGEEEEKLREELMAEIEGETGVTEKEAELEKKLKG